MQAAKIVVTGGTTYIGRAFVDFALTLPVKSILVYSQDELMIFEMQKRIKDQRVEYMLGNISDKDRLVIAFKNADYVLHADITQEVYSAENNPHPTIDTNIFGTINVIEAAIKRKVKSVLSVSNDKGVAPATTYGCTILAHEHLCIDGNTYNTNNSKFSVIRSGNIWGIEQDAIHAILASIAKDNSVYMTDGEVTRFYTKIVDLCQFIVWAFENMAGGEVFVPKTPSAKLKDLIGAIKKDDTKVTEKHVLRLGEKKHSIHVSEEEARHTFENDRCYIIVPERKWWPHKLHKWAGLSALKDGQIISSDINSKFFTVEQIREIVKSEYKEASH